MLTDNVTEAIKALTEKPVKSTSFQRVEIFASLKDAYRSLSQPERFGKIMFDFLSRVDVPIKANDVIAGRYTDKELTEEEELLDVYKRQAIGTSERTSDGKGKFYVYDVIADKVIAKPEFNLGNCRQIDYENGFCYVTSREDGLWVIDVTDPYNPVLGSHYDTSEMATGITVYSNTVFVANRQYGVDVIDVTDPYNPMFLTRIKTGEVQSLDVYEDTLFAGIWGEPVSYTHLDVYKRQEDTYA